jgi:hypothetical protein
MNSVLNLFGLRSLLFTTVWARTDLRALVPGSGDLDKDTCVSCPDEAGPKSDPTRFNDLRRKKPASQPLLP